MGFTPAAMFLRFWRLFRRGLDGEFDGRGGLELQPDDEGFRSVRVSSDSLSEGLARGQFLAVDCEAALVFAFPLLDDKARIVNRRLFRAVQGERHGRCLRCQSVGALGLVVSAALTAA